MLLILESKGDICPQVELLSSFLSLLVLTAYLAYVVKASASRAEDPGFESRLRRGRVIPVT